MSHRQRVIALLGLWAVLCVTAFVTLHQTAPSGDCFTRVLYRTSLFLQWQLAALVPGGLAYILGRRLPPGVLRRLSAVPAQLVMAALVGFLLLVIWAQFMA